MSEINKRIEALEAELQKLKNEVKPKFEVGKWYKTNCLGGSIFYLTESPVEDCYVSGYGFENGDWCDLSEHYWTLEQKYKPTLATHQEVEEALQKQYEKLGGKCKLDFCHYWNVNSCGFGCIYSSKGDEVFRKGVWAEIVKDEPIKIGGYSVVIKKSSFEKDSHNDSFEIGCKQMFRHQIQTIYYIMKNNNFKKVSFDGVETDIETINKILAL